MKIYIEEETDNAIKAQELNLKRQKQQLDDKKRNLKRAKLMKQLAQLKSTKIASPQINSKPFSRAAFNTVYLGETTWKH